ncbi:hypothetical protein KUH03_17915 [Sphingobacterium sp. E70]|uniref:hypothetical protein n=1 Tax=Sphingobacterium sp. E70 TaxID=2853439 RepID=UPI00211BB862|nr:hypothetical protein [Sphingobacterium sp. E70]ULT28295.1 hypothetical protein KUH03_17915 [Sphingobacterium sp. E70]
MRQINFSTYTQGAMKVAMNAGYLVAFIWGVYRLQSGQITFGTMTAFCNWSREFKHQFLH